MGLTKEPKGPGAPGMDQPDQGESGGVYMNATDAQRYGAVSARANYPGLDRAGVQFSHAAT